MNPGELRCLVTLQTRGAPVTGSLGARAGDWADAATFWAAIEPLEGSDATRAMQQGLRQPHRIRARYRTDVTTENRITYLGRAFEIRSVVDVEMRHRELEITAEEVKPA